MLTSKSRALSKVLGRASLSRFGLNATLQNYSKAQPLFTQNIRRELKIFQKAVKTEEVESIEAQIQKCRLIKEGYSNKLVAFWLLGTAGLVLFMICLGGYTRLTKSGLSMTKWKPVGYKYPRTIEEWNEEFDLYKKTPEFEVNKGMSLQDFKRIFFIEYFHRLFGNIIGFAFGVPLAYFFARGYFTRAMKMRTLGLFGIGGLQGLVGWWMVKSGFKEKPSYQTRPRVSTYRLIVHNSFAVSIYSYLLYLGLKVWSPVKSIAGAFDPAALKKSRRFAILLLHCVAFNLVTGVSVAGIDAGSVYNTWPDMNGKVVPQNYWVDELGYRNLFENMGTVQFNHRMFAYVTYTAATMAFLHLRKLPLPRNVKFGVNLIYLAVNWQVVYGIYMLLSMVKVEQGVAHQLSGMLVLTSILYLLAASNRKYIPIK